MLFVDNILRKGDDILSIVDDQVYEVQEDDVEEIDSEM